MKKSTKNKLEFISFRIILFIFRILPYKIVELIVTNILVFGGMTLGIRKKVAENNLKMVFPDKSKKEINSIMKEMYYLLGKTTAETYFCAPQKLYEKVTLEGWNNLEKAVAENKGVILAAGHIGNWELAGRFIARKYKLSVVYKKLRNKYFNEYTNKLRNKDNVILIDKKQALKPILKLLAQHYIVTIMIDQNAGKDGILTNFLGHPASTFLGISKIAVKTGTPIVPAIAVRLSDGSNKFIFKEVIDPNNYDKSPEKIKELTEKVSLEIEKYILKYPSSWFWVHRRWRGSKKAKKI